MSTVIRPIKPMQTNKNCTDKIQKCLCKFHTYTSKLQKFNEFTSSKAQEKKKSVNCFWMWALQMNVLLHDINITTFLLVMQGKNKW